ncbi:hypothetical protein GMRT_10387 [Giardia muris]|uniref:Uncharacterized protein n=1 Tax=Giardia muris TaxID=5742 RepID=A0A4Z1T8A2_GIAMU|nr:hypothetical protein GMRT_10387 [Giardia muris]|eukprot:TNJ30343.1 hypothetical protein GMRT_10387 [Giardia muris]
MEDEEISLHRVTDPSEPLSVLGSPEAPAQVTRSPTVPPTTIYPQAYVYPPDAAENWPSHSVNPTGLLEESKLQTPVGHSLPRSNQLSSPANNETLLIRTITFTVPNSDMSANDIYKQSSQLIGLADRPESASQASEVEPQVDQQHLSRTIDKEICYVRAVRSEESMDASEPNISDDQRLPTDEDPEQIPVEPSLSPETSDEGMGTVSELTLTFSQRLPHEKVILHPRSTESSVPPPIVLSGPNEQSRVEDGRSIFSSTHRVRQEESRPIVAAGATRTRDAPRKDSIQPPLLLNEKGADVAKTAETTSIRTVSSPNILDKASTASDPTLHLTDICPRAGASPLQRSIHSTEFDGFEVVDAMLQTETLGIRPHHREQDERTDEPVNELPSDSFISDSERPSTRDTIYYASSHVPTVTSPGTVPEQIAISDRARRWQEQRQQRKESQSSFVQSVPLPRRSVQTGASERSMAPAVSLAHTLPDQPERISRMVPNSQISDDFLTLVETVGDIADRLDEAIGDITLVHSVPIQTSFALTPPTVPLSSDVDARPSGHLRPQGLRPAAQPAYPSPLLRNVVYDSAQQSPTDNSSSYHSVRPQLAMSTPPRQDQTSAYELEYHHPNAQVTGYMSQQSSQYRTRNDLSIQREPTVPPAVSLYTTAETLPPSQFTTTQLPDSQINRSTISIDDLEKVPPKQIGILKPGAPSITSLFQPPEHFLQQTLTAHDTGTSIVTMFEPPQLPVNDLLSMETEVRPGVNLSLMDKPPASLLESYHHTELPVIKPYDHDELETLKAIPGKDTPTKTAASPLAAIELPSQNYDSNYQQVESTPMEQPEAPPLNLAVTESLPLTEPQVVPESEPEPVCGPEIVTEPEPVLESIPEPEQPVISQPREEVSNEAAQE